MAAREGDCIDYGGFNENIGAGDLDGDGVLDVVSTYGYPFSRLTRSHRWAGAMQLAQAHQANTS